jgi:small GTP-binding protein
MALSNKRSLKLNKVQPDYNIRFLIMGDTGVGKSSLISTFADQEFPKNIIGTNGIDHVVKNFKLNGNQIKLQIWDTAGQEKHRKIASDYFRDVAGIILVYDVTDATSYENLTKFWLPRIYNNSGTNIELALIGNKTDLVFNDDEKRQVD